MEDSEEECLCAFGCAHYWDWCELHQDYDEEAKCPIHYKEN